MLHPITANINETPQYDIAPFIMLSPDMSKVRQLTDDNTAEVQEFLSVRPVHTVVMSSFIVDNGIESDLNRGKFYGYRSAAGELEGVALIGHSTLVEARSDEALRALAVIARNSETPIHLIMSSGNDAERFHLQMTGGMAEPRLKCTEALFEVSFPFAVQKCEWNIENADMSQLEQVAEAQAEIAFIECGVDPMLKDREGFLKRVARRIEQGRVFTVYSDGKLIFKADIIAETTETIYLEGIYVHPDHRGAGLGSRCLAALTQQLLGRVENICLLSNVDFKRAHSSFEKAGYRRSDQCVTLFV
ncbi:MAG: GNAT family N-acetyltransferase [Chloracidobacterium sp.]|nr:GNAT family N-acetyltransferase [Chloracidobacterium sp.]